MLTEKNPKSIPTLWALPFYPKDFFNVVNTHFYCALADICATWIKSALIATIYPLREVPSHSLWRSHYIVSPTRMHSSRMRSARLLTVSRSIRLGWGVAQPPVMQTPPPSVDRQTPVKISPCPKLRLRAVKIPPLATS